MKMLKLRFLPGVWSGWSLLSHPGLPTSRSLKPAEDTDKTMAKLSQLVGGTWVNTDPKFVVELRYEWAFGKKAIRGLGVTGKGRASARARSKQFSDQIQSTRRCTISTVTAETTS